MAKIRTSTFGAALLLLATSSFAQDGPRLARDAVSAIDVVFSGHSAAVFNTTTDQRITAICGFFEYDTPMGRRQRTRWTYNFSGPLALENCLEPGEQYDYKPKRRLDDRSKFIEYEAFEVRGVVFATGETWGPLGNYCRSRMADVARATRLQISEMELINKEDPKRFQDFIQAEEPMLHGHEAKTVHLSLRSLLLDSKGKLRQDYEEVLREIIVRLSRY